MTPKAADVERCLRHQRAIHGIAGGAVEFTSSGNDEMDEASGNGWGELEEDGTLEGQICFDRGDEIDFDLFQQPVSRIPRLLFVTP